MGNNCIRAADAVTHLVTETEIHEAVRSIEEWQKIQTATVKSGAAGQNTYGPLLQRVGGPDVVKKVVELFYRKLYADPRLILFLHDQDVMHLRAKQSAFISWLFGPPDVPYLGRSVRIAHLRIVKQRGFMGDDFDLGMRYFEQSMAELGAPEAIIGEVMRRLRPFKDAFFTPSPKDAEEEARWAAEEREKEEAVRQHQLEEQEEEAHHERERRLQEQITLAHRVAAAAEEEEAEERTGDAAVAAAVIAALSTGAVRPSSRTSQCPFTGGSRSAAVSASGAVAAASMSTPPRPATPPAAAGVSANPFSGCSNSGDLVPFAPPGQTAEAACAARGSVAEARPLHRGPGGSDSVPVRHPASQVTTQPDNGLGQSPQSAIGTSAADPLAGLSSPAAPQPSTPPEATADRPGFIEVTDGSTTAAAMAPAPAPVATATASKAAAVAPDPPVDLVAELEEIDRNGGKGSSEHVPLLPPSLEPSS
ncbi:hypothetical protein Vretimale_14304 [Volvox reticuliferus]|uniref:Globin n=1 Tax=Volvox reticuliferus TaxID=1737510 RepID=A0A8J4FV29_9CHLO|nr:hypothetical protein Vretifemale_15304 [Volvox reticuliferus]GIM10717.1 hypothetical protein Vretimale_14304 [Volvox reticuliferus]